MKKPDFDELLSSAIYYCKKTDQLSPAYLQRILETDFETAKKLFFELVKIKIVEFSGETTDDEDNYLGTINKKVLETFLIN